MTEGLRRRANRIARRRARGIVTPVFPEVPYEPSSPDPWAGIPESEREVVVKVRNGLVIGTYIDAPEMLAKRKAARSLKQRLKPATSNSAEGKLSAATTSEPWTRLDEADER